jgi:putative PIN family toxin of toxin-antitoxin system
MPARKRRLPITLDTNIFVRSFKARSATNPNRRIVRLWLLEKRLQLVVSPQLVTEYLEIFAEVLGMNVALIEEWRLRFERDPRVTVVRPAAVYTESRDPDDNVVLSTARAGKARFLVTNDRDLLDLPAEFQRAQPFGIVGPQTFLREVEVELSR